MARPRAAEPRATEPRAAEAGATEPRAAKPRAAKARAPEPHTAEARPAAPRSPAEPTQERARRTRRAILLAASECFAEVGYAAATTSEIAARAGVTKGALAFHFPAKAAVAAAIVEECYEQWPWPAAEAAPAHDRVLDLVGEVFARIAAQIREDPIVRATVRLQAERSQISEPVHVPFVDWIAASTELFRTAAERGELRPGADPGALARASVAGFQGVQHVSGILSGHADVADRVAEWWSVMRAGIAAASDDPASDDPASADPATADHASADHASAGPASGDHAS